MTDRIREVVSEPPAAAYVAERAAAGWVMSAVEWTRVGAEAERSSNSAAMEEVPYGQRVAPDCGHLIEDLLETDVLLFIYERVVSGWRPPQIANALNSRGYRTRSESPWTPAAVFDLIPRLIELSPKLQKREDWPVRRSKLEVIA